MEASEERAKFAINSTRRPLEALEELGRQLFDRTSRRPERFELANERNSNKISRPMARPR